tara:strand:+ start:107 stop:439 length:333 start_codon:yes stop_codon:yes gene_type:complete
MATLGAAVVLIVVGHLCQGTDSAITLAFKLSSITSGALLGAVVWSLWKKQSSSQPIIFGMVTSLIAMATIAFGVPGEKLAWPWYTLTGTLITLGVASITGRAISPLSNKG